MTNPDALAGVVARVTEIVEPTTFRARLANGATFVSPEEIADLRTLLAALAEARKDSERVDWLETQRENVVERDSHGDPELVAFRWAVEEQRDSVRTALDAARGWQAV